MKGMSRVGLALGLAGLHLTAHAALIHGTYSGTVVAGGSGMIGTLNASTVAAGTPISGTFSYDSKIFNVNSGNATGWQYYALGSVNPVVITATVAGSTFQVSGTIQSELVLLALPSSQNPNNHFYLNATNWGSSVPGLSGSIGLNLSNYLGAPFASNIADPGSVAFTHQSSSGVNDLNTLQAINSSGNGTAALYFTITDASTASVTPDALLDELLKEVTGVAPEELADKVERAQDHIQATCSELTKFVNQVQLQNGKKIAAQLASKLVTEAQAIEVAIGCSSVGAVDR